jgi:hypothetical protein
MNSKLESAGQGELALTDWFRIAGLLIFLAFACFSIVLFGKGANHPSPNPTQPVVQASTPFAGLEPRPESTPEISAQSLAAATEPGTRSEATPFSGEALSPRLQQPPDRLGTEKPAIADAKGVNALGKHRTNSVTRRQASRRRSTVDKVVFKTVNTLVGVWRRAFKANK